MRILISPYSQRLRNGNTSHPKNYPHWPELIKLLKLNGYDIVQIGINGETKLTEMCLFNLQFSELKKLLNGVDTFIAVDNFFPHFANHYGKRGIVLFGQSDPNIFGYRSNVNLLKDRKYLRPDQFNIWESAKYNEDAFVKPDAVLMAINKTVFVKKN